MIELKEEIEEIQEEIAEADHEANEALTDEGLFLP